MTDFNYSASADLFPARTRSSRHKSVGYKRFALAAEAIRYVIEELPRELILGTYLEVDEERFDGAGIRRLYDGDAYPLVRRTN